MGKHIEMGYICFCCGSINAGGVIYKFQGQLFLTSPVWQPETEIYILNFSASPWHLFPTEVSIGQGGQVVRT